MLDDMFISDELFEGSESVASDGESNELYFGALPGTLSVVGYCNTYTKERRVQRPMAQLSSINRCLPPIDAIGKRYYELSHDGDAAIGQTVSERYEKLRELIGPER